MKKKKVTMGMILLAGTLLCACAATKETEETVQIQEGKDTADEPEITLDWYVNYSWFATPWGENLVSRTITEETGVNINFVTPMGNETEKLNSLIASDSLPDLITLGFWEPQVNQLISEGMVYPLNELAEEYDTYFWEVSDPAVVNWYTMEDGNIYGYPNSTISPQDLEENDKITSNQTFLVRKDIYEAIGSPDMSTPEGFADAVRKAAEEFPEVDGEPLIPIGAHVFDSGGNVSFDSYLMNFLAIPWEKNGRIYDRYTDPEYVTWLKMFRQLGEEGLLANDIFVDTRTQMEEKLAQGRYFCMIYQYSDIMSQQKTLYVNHPERIYLAAEGPRNEQKDDPTLTVSNLNGWTVTMISRNCKDPERAMKFLDYMISELGQKMIYLGVEGVTYDMVDGKPVLKEEVKEILDTDRTTYDQLYGADDTYWMLQNNVMQLAWQPAPGSAMEQLEQWAAKYTYYNGQYDSYLPMGSEEESANDKISKLWGETLPQLLLAPTEQEFDSLFAQFCKERDAMGYEKVIDAKTVLMKEAKEKLGMDE